MSKVCVIIGETTLLQQCAEQLRQRGWTIAAVVATNHELLQWAKREQYPVINPLSSLAEQLAAYSFEYLFSIVNPHLLGSDVLCQPTKLAVNFHDSLLPHYAGINATAWAIYNREVQHGITWHVMADTVDAGDILVQEELEIEPRETTHSLNLKCYEAALRGFVRLLEQIETQQLVAQKQRSERSYFAKTKVLPNFGFVQWSQSAAAIDAQVRAVNFGGYENTIGTVKVKTSCGYFLVLQSEIVETSEAVPGTIFKISDGALGIATGNGGLLLRRVADCYGAGVELQQLVLQHQLAVGVVLLEAEQFSQQPSLKSEARWARQLAELEAPSLYFLSGQESRDAQDVRSIALELGSANLPNTIAAAFLCYLRRVLRSDNFDVTLQRFDIDALPVSKQIPLKLSLDAKRSSAELVAELQQQFGDALRGESFCTDIFYRYPELVELKAAQSFAALPVSVAFVDDVSRVTANSSSLMLAIDSEARATIFYQPTAVREAQLQRFARRFSLFFANFKSAGTKELCAVALLDDAELQDLLRKSEGVVAPSQTFLDVFAQQVELSPDAVAVIFEQQQLTYDELDRASTCYAQLLKQRGVKHGDFVVLAAKRSEQFMVAVLGIFKAAAVYVPIDPQLPAMRKQFMVRDSQARCVIADRELFAEFSESEVALLEPESWQSVSGMQAVALERPQVSDLAYMIYTSGSTGLPKGVLVSHGNMQAVLEESRKVFRLSPGAVVFSQISIGFDASVVEMFISLFCGATCKPLPREVISDATAFRAVVEAQSPGVLMTVPSQIKALLAVGWRGQGLELLTTGGEALTVALAQEVRALGLRLVNLYGPTETSVYASYYDVQEAGRYPDAYTESIGCVVTQARMYIVDEFFNLLPPDVPGEIIIGGAFVAQGYCNRESLTAERFLLDPFVNDGQARVYRSGDLGRFFDDGNLEFFGRLDNQVKIRGVRIELGEVEEAIRQHCEVQDCLVLVKSDSAGNKMLVAYVISTASAAMLQQHCKQHLSHHALPSAIVVLDAFPLLTSGKINQNALPVPSQRCSDRPFIPPRDATEYQLCCIWEELLDVRPISVLDDFFDLGGHSLLAVSLQNKVRQRFAKQLPLAMFANSISVEQMAVAIKSDAVAANWSPLVPLAGADEQKIFLVHPFGGTAFCYAELARSLAPNFSTFGIQARGAEMDQQPFSEIPAMASYYLQEIRRSGVAAPYFIGGYSYGGLVAFEMALQLEIQGERDFKLLIIDSPCPTLFQPDQVAVDDDIVFLYETFKDFTSLSLSEIQKQGSKEEQFAYVLGCLAAANIVPPDFDMKQAMHFFELYKAHEASHKIYKAGVLQSDIHLFCSAEKESKLFTKHEHDATLGWKNFTTQEVVLHRVNASSHQEILAQPFVQKLATAIAATVCGE